MRKSAYIGVKNDENQMDMDRHHPIHDQLWRELYVFPVTAIG